MGKLSDLVQELGEKAYELVNNDDKSALLAVSLEDTGNGDELECKVVILGRGKHVALAISQLLEALPKDKEGINRLNDEAKQRIEGKKHDYH